MPEPSSPHQLASSDLVRPLLVKAASVGVDCGQSRPQDFCSSDSNSIVGGENASTDTCLGASIAAAASYVDHPSAVCLTWWSCLPIVPILDSSPHLSLMS